MSPEPATLRRQLLAVARRQIDRVFDTVHGEPPIIAPELFDLVEGLNREAWQADPVEALYAAIEKAASRLGDETIRGAPSLTFGYVITKLFNLAREDLGHVDGHQYDYLLEQIFGFDRALRKKVAERVRVRLAKELLDMAASMEKPSRARATQVKEQNMSGPNLDLINRDEWVQKVIAELGITTPGARVFHPVCIWGEPGTGKTVLAEQVAQKLAAHSVAKLHAGNPDILRDDIAYLLMVEGLKPVDRDDDMAALKRFLETAAERKTQVLIIDNVTDEQFIEWLIPERSCIPVLLTMRQEPKAERFRCIELDDFTEEEAFSFVKGQLDDTDEQIRALSAVLGYRPLALDQAVRVVKASPGLRLADVIQPLSLSLKDGLPLVTPLEPSERNLIELYKLVLNSLEDKPWAQDVLLHFLVVAGNSGVEHRDLVVAFMENKAASSYNKLYVHSGLLALKRLGLLREEGYPQTVDPAGVSVAYLVMHPLTYRIVRDLVISRLFRLEVEYLEFLDTFDLRSNDPTMDRPMQNALAQARIIALAGKAMQPHLPDGWLYIRCIDRHTWIVIREETDDSGVAQQYAVRYEVYRYGIYKLDYRTGVRSQIAPFIRPTRELAQFYKAVEIYNEVVPPRLREINWDESPRAERERETQGEG